MMKLKSLKEKIVLSRNARAKSATNCPPDIFTTRFCVELQMQSINIDFPQPEAP